MFRTVSIWIAGLYTALGVAALIVAFVIPSDDPLSAIVALLPALPWSALMSTLGLYSEDSLAVNIALITGAIALNAGLLWWWALTRKR